MRNRLILFYLLLAINTLWLSASEFPASQFFQAINVNDFQLLDKITKIGGFPDITNDKKETLLMHAVLDQNTQAIEYLLSKGADINAQDVNGRTSLMIAAVLENAQVTNLLLENPNINVNAQDNEGNTALMMAAAKRSIDNFNAIYGQKDVSRNITNHYNRTFFQEAIIVNNYEIVKYVISSGYKLNSLDFNSLIWLSATIKKMDLINLLPEPEIENYLNNNDYNSIYLKNIMENNYYELLKLFVLKSKEFPLTKLIYEGNYVQYKTEIEARADIDFIIEISPVNDNLLSLLVNCSLGNVELTRFVLEKDKQKIFLTNKLIFKMLLEASVYSNSMDMLKLIVAYK